MVDTKSKLGKSKPIQVLTPADYSEKDVPKNQKIPKGDWQWRVKHEYRAPDYKKAREDFPTYQDWFEAGKYVWTDDEGIWGLRKYPGYNITAIIHYCDDYEHGHFTGTLTGPERCCRCREQASDEVMALHMLQNPKWYDKSDEG